MHTPSVAIVILNWNGRKFLEQFMPSVMASTYANMRVVVADNGSTDASLDFLRHSYPEVRLIILGENFGFAKGYNEALQQVEADYYILLNSDVMVQPGWIEPMVRLVQGNEQIVACQPKLLSYHQQQYFEYAGAAGGWLDAYGYPFARGRIFDVCETDEGQYDTAAPIFWASGAALFIKAAVFHEVGGFDPYFFAHQEEIDLCWRVQLAGYKIYACPESVVYHVGGGTLPKGNSLKTYLNFRNNQVMIYKNMQGWRRHYTLAARLVLDAVSAVKALFSGNGGYAVAVVSAHGSFLKWVFTAKRKGVFPVRRTGWLHGYYKGNIVWDHFVRGKKKFSQIVKNH